jgi:hypothetical protein
MREGPVLTQRATVSFLLKLYGKPGRNRSIQPAASRLAGTQVALDRQKNREKYIPMPPGITYWHSVTVETPAGPREINVPRTRPLASCERDLEDDDVLALLV